MRSSLIARAPWESVNDGVKRARRHRGYHPKLARAVLLILPLVGRADHYGPGLFT